MIIFSTILSLYIGFCIYIEALLEEFRCIIAKLNILANRKYRSPTEEKEIMIEAIKLHLEMLT